jgi:hypothetical protein
VHFFLGRVGWADEFFGVELGGYLSGQSWESVFLLRKSWKGRVIYCSAARVFCFWVEVGW